MAERQLLLAGRSTATIRRKHERFKVQDTLEGHLVRAGGKKAKVTLYDISKGGISFAIGREEAGPESEMKVVLKLSCREAERSFHCTFMVRNRYQDEIGSIRLHSEILGDFENLKSLAFLAEFVSSVQGHGTNTAA